MFNWSEVHVSEMTCYKILTLVSKVFFQLLEDIFDYLIALLNNDSFHCKLNYWDALQVSAPFKFASIYIDKKGTAQKKEEITISRKAAEFCINYTAKSYYYDYVRISG